MTLLNDGGWRLWVSKGYSARYYYISHTGCSSWQGDGSCGMVSVNANLVDRHRSCGQCSKAPPSEMMGMIKLIEWER
jgi:hypothetical protein